LKIEIRQLTSNSQLSESTLCFTCSVYVNGVKAFTAMNRGLGGCHDYYPVKGQTSELINKAEEYTKSLPPVDGLDSDLDLVIDRLVDRELARKELVKAFKTRLLFKGKDGGLKEANVAKSTPEGIAMFKKGLVNEGYICLNDLPIDEAIDIYLEAVQ
jgi:hypothetical protein